MPTKKSVAKKALTPELARKRKARIMAGQPVVAGSALTNRDLSKESKAAMRVKYAPLETKQHKQLDMARNQQRDVGGFYDAYLKQVAQHAANTQTIGQQAVTAGQQTQNAVTGLARADLTGLQNPATADAQARGATAGDLSQMASNAAAVRQALVGSFVQQQAGQSAAASNYADSQAHVVAPGQKLGALAMAQGRVRQVREDVTATARQKGADRQAYEAGVRSDEGKNVLARQIAAGNLADKAADNALANKRVTEDIRHNKAGDTEKSRHDRALEVATQKSADRAAAKDAAAINKYGIRNDKWASMTEAARRKIINAKSGGTTGTKKGPSWLTPGQANAGLTQLPTLKDYVGRAMHGKPFIPGHGAQKPMTREQAEAKVRANTKQLKSPALLTAAADAVQLHYLPEATMRALRDAGFKPTVVARALGVKTSKQAGPKSGEKGSGAPGTGRPS
jgi:hypothetical protein